MASVVAADEGSTQIDFAWVRILEDLMASTPLPPTLAVALGSIRGLLGPAVFDRLRAHLDDQRAVWKYGSYLAGEGLREEFMVIFRCPWLISAFPFLFVKAL